MKITSLIPAMWNSWAAIDESLSKTDLLQIQQILIDHLPDNWMIDIDNTSNIGIRVTGDSVKAAVWHPTRSQIPIDNQAELDDLKDIFYGIGMHARVQHSGVGSALVTFDSLSDAFKGVAGDELHPDMVNDVAAVMMSLKVSYA